jgi:ribosomal protein S18 acetylase RimI-like enzyme
MQVDLRPLQEFDLKDVDRVIQAAFQRPVSALGQLQLQLKVEPEGFWVATSADQIVATVGCTDYGQFAYICLMCVLPQYQGQGLGRQMMEHALRWLENRGGRIVLLDATDMGARMYEDMGFVTDSTAIQFERARVVASAADDVSVRVATQDDLTAIAQFDAPLFGANRQKILDALWGQHCERYLITHDRAGQVTG